MGFELKEKINTETMIKSVSKIPAVKVNRNKFLEKELKHLYSKETVDLAISVNPAYAGISKEDMHKIAKQVINFETNKVSSLSFAAGLPGGAAMLATIPLDITQYFSFILIVVQKLAYLYGFEEFDLKEDQISDNTLNQLMLFLGVMFGVQGTNGILKKIAIDVAKNIDKNLKKKSLTKGVVYPAIKRIVNSKLGGKLTIPVFSKAVGDAVGIGIGGVLSGAITYASFKPCAIRLMKEFEKLPICDPDTYKKEEP